jgi:hypothetical protein
VSAFARVKLLPRVCTDARYCTALGVLTKTPDEDYLEYKSKVVRVLAPGSGEVIQNRRYMAVKSDVRPLSLCSAFRRTSVSKSAIVYHQLMPCPFQVCGDSHMWNIVGRANFTGLADKEVSSQFDAIAKFYGRARYR